MSGRWNYSDEARFEKRDEARATDARLDDSTCAECGDELQEGERELCAPCRVYIEGEEENDDGNY